MRVVFLYAAVALSLILWVTALFTDVPGGERMDFLQFALIFSALAGVAKLEQKP